MLANSLIVGTSALTVCTGLVIVSEDRTCCVVGHFQPGTVGGTPPSPGERLNPNAAVPGSLKAPLREFLATYAPRLGRGARAWVLHAAMIRDADDEDSSESGDDERGTRIAFNDQTVTGKDLLVLRQLLTDPILHQTLVEPASMGGVLQLPAANVAWLRYRSPRNEAEWGTQNSEGSMLVNGTGAPGVAPMVYVHGRQMQY